MILSVNGLNYQRGFTLVELLVVLVIVALVYGMAAPVLFSASDRRQVSRATASLYEGLRRARGEAIASGRAVSRDPGALLAGAKVTLTRHGMQNGPIIFFPDGSATAAQLNLSAGTERRGVAVDWLTGHVALSE